MQTARQCLISVVCLLFVGMVASVVSPVLAAEPSLSIAVSPATSVAHSEEVTLTAEMSDSAQVASYRWAHVGGSQNIGAQQAVTLGGSGWPNSAGTRTFQAIVTLNDGSQVTAEQAIAFTNPPPPPPPPDVSVSISVSPDTSVSYSEEVTLTAELSGPAEVASYRWAHVDGWHRVGTQQAVTLGGAGWPNSAGTRTFQAIVTLNDGSQVTAEQAIAFTNPPPPPPPPGTSVSISVSPSTTVMHSEEVTLSAHVSDHADHIESYRWAHIGGYHKIGTAQTLTLGGDGWPTSPSTRTFEVTVTFTDGTQLTASRAIAFTNKPEDATLARIRRDFVGDATTVEEFVLVLPEHHKSRAIFMLESQAGDAEFASPSTPRAISWGATADDLFSWGTNDQSPRYDEVEFITKEYGEWVFGVIDFTASPPALSKETEACHSCHVNGHPIWGLNYRWPGIFHFVAGDSLSYDNWLKDLKSSGDPRVTQVWTDPGYGVGSSSVLKSLEMEEAVVTRHAEVLTESLLPEEGTTDRVKELLCPYGRDTVLDELGGGRDFDRATEALFPVAHWPHAMRDSDGTVRDVAADRPLEIQNALGESNANLCNPGHVSD